MTMIEKVARAIRDASDKTGMEYDICEIQLARAAIEAMREPTDEMIHKVPIGYCTAREVWECMIDAALKEDKCDWDNAMEKF